MAKKVYLGVGHGGTDPGAVGNGLKEKDVNLTMALACKADLERHGVVVKISRTADSNKDLSARIKECNAFAPDLALDVHNNAGGGDGAEVIHYSGGGVSKKLAENILDEVKKIGQNSRGCKTRLGENGNDYFGFIREVNCPSVITETAFLDNATDVKIIDTTAEQKAMGVAIAKGILKTLGITYKVDAKKTTAKKRLLDSSGYKKGDKTSGVLAVKNLLILAKKAKIITQSVDNNSTFGDGTEKAVNQVLKKLGYKQNGIAGNNFIKKLSNLIGKEIK